MTNKRKENLLMVALLLFALAVSWLTFMMNHEVQKARFPSAPAWTHWFK